MSDNSAPHGSFSLWGRVWRRLWGEASWVRSHGTLREKERYGFLSRANYAYGLLRAADVAGCFGKKAVTACEFGVASGDGLVNMIELGKLISRETGIAFRIVGFDTGAGLPPVRGYKDHPELWSGGDFPMQDKEALLRRTEGRAEIRFGDIKETVDGFVDSLDPSSPLGFISVDVDIYSASKSSLRSLLGPAEKYCPAVSCYFDDVGFFFANPWCGELAAINEFNEEQALRKIDLDRSLPGRRPELAAPWYKSMYVCHVLDHEARTSPRPRESLSLGSHDEWMNRHHLY